MDNNEFQKTPCTDECYVRISDLKEAILNNPYDPAKGEIGGYLRYLKYNTPFRTDTRKPGRWERHYSRPGVFADLFWHCSCCGFKNENQYANVYHKFCPNCGAKMEGEE